MKASKNNFSRNGNYDNSSSSGTDNESKNNDGVLGFAKNFMNKFSK